MTIQAKALVRLTGIILSLSLLTTIAAKAQAGAGDSGSTGSFNINEKSVEIKKGGDYTITGNKQTTNTITVDLKDGGTANITIEGVDISKAGTSECPFNIIQGTVNLTLAGKDDKLQAGYNYAALQVSENSKLVITENSKGKLTATGGSDGAGIGGGFDMGSPAGSITIAGGTVEAIGGFGGAGIGGGSRSDAGSITIAGGTVVATGGVKGAGIGGGETSSVGSITILGGTVVVTGGDDGAGIGGGSYSNVGSITIEGGTVDATGRNGGAGIGGGFGNSGGTIIIEGGKITTEGNIGAGKGGSDATGKIEGGTIVCKSISPALSISGGSVRTEDNSVDKDGKVMAVVKGSSKELPANSKVTSITIGEETYNWKDVYTDENGMLYLYLQQDQPGSATVTIDTQTYTANASREYDITKGPVAIKAAGDYAIVGGETRTGNAITVELPNKEAVANITIEGVDILKAKNFECPFNIIKGTVHLTLVGEGNVLQAGDGCAALQVSKISKLVITENSKGKLTARGGASGAGIGGGYSSPAGSITIEGGTVEARGGDEAAGIGGSLAGSGGSIIISGGTVKATGGDLGAGIGGGFGSSDVSITISGGKITTEGNIGDGERSQSPAKGTISGGTIVCKSISPTLSITGGSVRTKDNSVVNGKVMAVVKGSSKELPANSKVTSITIGKVTYKWTDVYTDENGMLYLYLEQDQPGSATVTIDTKTYTANASREYDITKESVTIAAAGDYAIVGGGTKTENAIEVKLESKDAVANITIDGVNILKSNQKECPFNIIQGTVNLTLSGNDNKLKAGDGCAALQVSANSELLITKESTVKLTATGGHSGAGIGGSVGRDAGSITIAGGTVTATGGHGAAGIGGGNAGTISSITIEGGTVMATGGDLGASIGGSNESKGIINISGGTVMAYTNIGNSETGRTVTGKISGGTIVCGSITSTFTISGGSVHSLGNNVMNDGKGMAVIKGLPANAKVESITIDKDNTYGLNDVYTDDNGLLYLYIPKDKPVPLSLTMTDQEEYSASYVATSDKYLYDEPEANASLVQKTKGRKPVLFRNQNGGIIEMDGGWKDMPTVGSLVELKIKTNSVLNYNKLEGISKEDLNVKFTGKDKDNGEADCILTYTISFNMPNQDVCISLFDKLLVEGSKEGYKVKLNQLTITHPGEYTLKGAYAFLSDEEKKEINPSEVGVVFSVAVENGIGGVTLHLDGVSLMSNTLSVPALSCGSGSGKAVKVVLDGDNYLEGGYGTAGINKGSDAGTLTIEGTGRLEVKGGSNAAGIGGNDGEQANNIKIAGGTIVAKGDSKNIAGIGSGADGSTATGIDITGGSVYATVPSLKDKKQTTAVTFPAMPGAKVINANVEDLGGYGLPGMNLYPDDKSATATLYLWLPDGYTNKEITINGYSGKVTAGGSATLKVITINTNESYNPDTHKDKSITIPSGFTFTIDAADASVIDLTIKKGGKLLTNKELKVKGRFTVEPNADENKWITFCSPVPLNLLNQRWATWAGDTNCLFLQSGFTTATDQEWTLEQSLKEDTPYLIGVPTGVVACTLYAQNVKLPGRENIDIKTPSGFDNNLLFRANTSLTEQKLKDIYVLEVPSQKLVLKTEDYILKPFEAFFVASRATRNMFKTISLLGSDGQPTGIAEVKVQKNTNFKAYSNSPGTLTFENQGEPAAVIVVNALGKGMFVYSNFTGSKHLYGLSAGVYFVRSNKEVKTVIVY